jgi:ribosomal protein S9
MKILKNGMYLLLVLLLSTTISCNEDEVINNNIGGLDFVIATLNADGNKVGVVATTVPGDNRTLYTVDFGSTADDDTDVFETSGPMVSFDYPKESATYMLTVTASFPGQNDVSISKEHTVTIVEPAPTGDGLTGVWKLAPEAGAIGVGPAQDNVSWWSNTTDDIATRSCLFDDEYVFGADGSFQNVVGTSTWVEAWQGAAGEECGTPVAPHDGTATDATYEYNGSTVTINGTGAFLGLAKVINGAEISSPADAADSITYIATLSEDGLTLELDIEVAGGGFWSFKLVKDAPPAPSALDGTWRLAPESGALGVGPALNNVSWWSSTSDDVATRSCLFDDEYVFGADGSFQNVVGASTWIEAWQGTDPENCGAPVAPHDGTATATYTYDEAAGTITINGTGAYLGLAKVINGAEISSPADAADSITYIAALSEDGNSLELDIEVAGGGHWSFKLVKDVVPVGVEGTWKLSPVSGALGVGPALNNVSWWSSTTDDVATRACLFDDEYVFGADGSFQNILGAQTWVEAWQGTDPENCGAPVAPHDGTATATYTYDEAAGTITINGTGAYLGLAKVINGAEISSPADAADSITYIAALSADGLTLDIDIEVAGGGHWSFKLARQ